MVQIFIKLEDKDKLNEWSIVEIQGDLEVASGESLANKCLGNLHFTKDGVPILIIGHHVLHGKVVNLDKPLLVMRKTRQQMAALPDAMDTDEAAKTLTQYLVKAIVRRKLLFNKRPRPIVQECKK